MPVDYSLYLVSKAVKLVNDSSGKDHIYSVAGDLSTSIPNDVLEMERLLNSASLAVSRADYEVVSSFLCKIFIGQFFEERQVLTHFSYRA